MTLVVGHELRLVYQTSIVRQLTGHPWPSLSPVVIQVTLARTLAVAPRPTAGLACTLRTSTRLGRRFSLILHERPAIAMPLQVPRNATGLNIVPVIEMVT